MREVGFSGGTENGDKKKKKSGRKKGAPPSGQVKLYAQQRIKNPTLSKRKAALAVGFTQSMADNVKAKIEDPHRAYFERLANAVVPDELLILKAREGLKATKVVTASFEGKITDTQEFADFATRLPYIELLGEFKGVIQRRGTANIKVDNKTIILTAEERKQKVIDLLREGAQRIEKV